jgi:membrane dipeptidase
LDTVTESPISDRAHRLHREAVVIDGLIGAMQNLDPILSGGITTGNVTVASSATQDPLEVLRRVAEYHDQARLYPDKFLVVDRAEDIERAKAAGMTAALLGVQGCDFIGKDIDLIQISQLCGLRIMQPTYNEENHLGYGCLEKDRGLKAFGRICIREFNRLGMMPDLSHVGQQTALDVIEASSTVCIISHGNPRALNDNPRCISDDVIKAIAEVDGVMGISTYSSFCETTFGVRPTLTDVLDHISHVAELVGVDHVGLGTDKFEGRSELSFQRAMVRKYPEVLRDYMTAESRHAEGLTSSADLPKITQGLIDRGFSDEDVVKIIGGNFLRAFKAVFGENAKN